MDAQAHGKMDKQAYVNSLQMLRQSDYNFDVRWWIQKYSMQNIRKSKDFAGVSFVCLSILYLYIRILLYDIKN